MLDLILINRIMVTHIHRNYLLIMNQQLQRDAVRQIDRYRMQTIKSAAQCMQAQRRVQRIGLQQLQGFKVLRAQVGMLL